MNNLLILKNFSLFSGFLPSDFIIPQNVAAKKRNDGKSAPIYSSGKQKKYLPIVWKNCAKNI